MRAIGLVTMVLLLAACGDDGDGKSCFSICDAAKQQSCTSIKDCSKFCVAAANLASKGNCQSQYNAYDSCARSTATCSIDATCKSQETAFTTCAAAFCLVNMSDADCVMIQEAL